MKKAIFSIIIPVTALSFALTAFVSVASAQVSTPVACPAGYTCTAIPTQPIGCPVGFTCTTNPTSTSTAPTTVSDAKVTIVRTPTLALTYDSARKESALTATFNLTVKAGNSGLYLYTGMANAGLFDQKGNQVSAGVNVGVAAGEKTDAYGRNYTIVSAGNTVQMTVTLTANPKQLFAGSYHAVLSDLYVFGSDNVPANLAVPSNHTNEKVIIGELSPYISSITPNVVSSGQNIVISGQRLNGASILIDNSPLSNVTIAVSTNGTSLNFTVPSLADGYHTIQVKDNITGASNSLTFQVQALTTISSATVVLNGTPTIALTYSPIQRESALTATFPISISGGNQGINIYKNVGEGAVFTDTTGMMHKYVIPTLTAVSPVSSTVDAYGNQSFFISPGQTVKFNAVAVVNPQSMFAGSYYASLNYIFGNPTDVSTISSSSMIQVPSNKTSTKTIVGELSPYISSVTNVTSQTITVSGQRLTTQTVPSFDGVKSSVSPSVSNQGTVATLKLPSLSDGWHSLTLSNTYGDSNQISFQVQSATTTQSSITVVSPNGGETWQVGTNQTITYQPTSQGVPVWSGTSDIFLIPSGSTYGYTIATSFPDAKALTWSVGMTVPEKTGSPSYYVNPGTYTIQVCKSGTSICDSSNNYFTITSTGSVGGVQVSNTSATLVNPTCSVVTGACTVQATFIFNLTAGNQPIYVPKTQLSSAVPTDSSSIAETLVSFRDSDTTSDSSTYFYIAPGQTKIFTANYQFTSGNGIFAIGSIYYGTSPSNLTSNSITSGLQNLQVTVSLGGGTTTQPSITVTSPNGGTYNIGDSIPVSWSSNGAVVGPIELDICPVGSSCGGGIVNTPQPLNGSYSWITPSILQPGQYKIGVRAINNPTVYFYSQVFTITSATSTSQPPVISGGTFPTSLTLGQTGTWAVNASDPQNGSLSYSVNWGDVIVERASLSSTQSSFIQTSTFTHVYKTAGTYTITFTVKNASGLSAQTTSTVKVGNVTPVCPAGYVCTPVNQPTTCPVGYTCTNVTANCPSGFTCSTQTPVTTPVSVSATATYSCPTGTTLNSSNNTCSKTTSLAAAVTYLCKTGYTFSRLTRNCLSRNNVPLAATATYSCTAGSTLNSSNNTCVTVTSVPANVKYTCSSGYSLNSSTKMCSKSGTTTIEANVWTAIANWFAGWFM